MNHSKKSIALALTILFFSYTKGQFRKYSNEFLNIGAGARGLAMGGAQVASVHDVTAGYWNPSGLTAVTTHPSAIAMHADYFSGIGKYDYFALAFPTKTPNRTIGISFLRFAVDDIPNTLFLVQPDGSINYNNITSFSSSDYAFLLSYAQRLNNKKGNNISVGGNAKIIYRKVGSFASAIGFGFDAGIRAQKGKWLLGATIRDITTTFNAWSFTFTDREKEILYLTNNDIPVKSIENTAPRLILAAGRTFQISKKLQLLTEANAHLTFDGARNTLISSSTVSIDPNIGVEANFNNSLFLRAGISNFQRALSDGDLTNQKKVWIYQPSFGAGFKVGNAVIDYAFTNLANQDNPLYTHIFSLKVDLLKKGNKK